MADIAFLITRSPSPCEPTAVVDHARALGLPLEVQDDQSSAGATELASFSFGDGRPGMMVCTFLPVPHPDALNMAIGPLSPTTEDLQAASSHMILVGFGIEGTTVERDALMYQFAAAVSRATDAVAVAVGPAVNFQRADVFADLAGLIPEHGMPSELAITVTTEIEPEATMSIMTHGLDRFQREEFVLHADPEGEGAMALIFDMARWVMADPNMRLPTGDTVGRTEDEKLLIGRRPHPSTEGAEVITLTPLNNS